MHIHELNPKRTAITLVLFALVIVFGLLTVVNPRLRYAQSPEETIEMVIWEEGTVFPYELVEILDGSVDTILLVDLRNNFEFGKGNIPGSENISSVALLEKDNIERLEQLKKDGIVVLLYAETQRDANGPWMVLRQLGFDNVKILLGGYNYYNEWKDNLGDSYADDSYFMGTPDYDFNEVTSNANVGGSDDDSGKAKVTFTRKKKTAVAEGGC